MALLDQLRQVGIAAGDLVMVHTSMRAVGGRAEDLIAALQAAVTETGTLLILLAADEEDPYDPLESEAWEDLGVLPEVFRTWPDVQVNDHPVARFSAWGTEAHALIADPPLHDYYGPNSPLQRLHARGGKVLRLGADWDTVTLIHYAEYVAEIPNKRRIEHTVELASGGEVRVRCLDDEHGIADWDGEDYFAVITKAFVADGLANTGVVGGARTEVLPAQALVAYAVGWLQAQFGGDEGRDPPAG